MKRILVRGLQTPDATDDPHYPAALERAKEAVRKLQEARILDAEGRRLRTGLPFAISEFPDVSQFRLWRSAETGHNRA
jgi:hypothetical protein